MKKILSIKANVFIIIALCFFIFNNKVFSKNESKKKVVKKDIEIFAKGKKYNSTREYKLLKLKKVLKDFLNYSEKKGQYNIVQTLINDFVDGEFNDLDKRRFREIMSELRRDIAESKIFENTKERGFKDSKKVDEIDIMFEEYKRKHNKHPAAVLDKTKMKTIKIKP